MYIAVKSQDGASKSSARSYVLQSFFAGVLLASGAILAALSFGHNQFTKKSSVEISAFSQIAEVQTVRLPSTEPTNSQHESQDAVVVTFKSVVPKNSGLAKQLAARQTKPRPVRDEIVTSQGKPDEVVLDTSLATPSTDELAAMQGLHKVLRGSFKVALLSQPDADDPSRVVASGETKLETGAETFVASPPEATQSPLVVQEPVPELVTSSLSLKREFLRSVRIASDRTIKDKSIRTTQRQPARVALAIPKIGSRDVVKKSNSAVSIQHERGHTDEGFQELARIASLETTHDDLKGSLSELGISPSLPDYSVIQAMSSHLGQEAPTAVDTQASLTTHSVPMGSRANDDIRRIPSGKIQFFGMTLGGSDGQGGLNTGEKAHGDHKKFRSALVTETDRRADSTNENESGEQTSKGTPDPVATPTPSSTPTPPIPCDRGYEAFLWKTQIDDCLQRGTLSYEGIAPIGEEASKLQGWIISQARSHWPTIEYVPAGPAQEDRQTFLLLENTVVSLELLLGAQQSRDQGIVFGWLPKGFRVALAGHADSAIFLDDDLQVLSKDQENEGRYFLFLNAKPGVRLIALRDRSNDAQGASVSFPVQAGTATFLDLTEIRKVTISGQVLDAGSPRLKPISGAALTVAEQEGTPIGKGMTSDDGQFWLYEIPVAGKYPFFLDVWRENGFRHRYRVDPDKTKELSLFYLRSAQVLAWTAQLEGGVSPESGIVIGTLPNLLEKLVGTEELYFPVVESLEKSPSILPESYTLSSEEKLQVKTPMNAVTGSRFIAVQIPEGHTVASMTDRNGRKLWSELVVSQPGVLNVLGPY